MVTREDIRKLIGGYATGTLTEAERKLLFEAALNDQELFEELADEQTLRELLETPGAKQRLIASLAPRERAWWMKPWPWMTAAAAAAAAVVIGVVLLQPRPNREVAEVRAPAASVPAPVIEPAPPPLPPTAAETSLQSKAPRQKAETPQPLFDRLAEQPVNRLQQQGQQGRRDAAPKERREEADRLKAAEPTELEKAKDVQVAAAAAPAATPAARNADAAGGGAGGGAVGGAAGAAKGAVRSFALAVPPPPPPFAFDYSLTAEGRVRIVPKANGFLTVAVSDGNTATVVFPSRLVQANSANEIDVPANSISATIVFSAQTAEALTLAAPPAAAPTDPVPGTKADPNPSPNSRLTVVIPLRP